MSTSISKTWFLDRTSTGSCPFRHHPYCLPRWLNQLYILLKKQTFSHSQASSWSASGIVLPRRVMTLSIQPAHISTESEFRSL